MTTDPHLATPAGRPRARSLHLDLPGTPGQWNAITDVPGVRVGFRTHAPAESSIRTGVTAVLPRADSEVDVPCAAGVHILNGNGEMTGTAWIEEAGALSTPVLLTNSHAIGPCHQGAIDWMLRTKPALAERWLLPVVAETYDGYLNDINGGHVRPADAVHALETATGGPVEEGCVGGGTGMNCYGFKAGTGTASRQVRHGSALYHVGVLAQANFGARAELTVAGVPVGRHVPEDDPLGDSARAVMPAGAGSVVVVVATDAPMLPGQCKALARRVPLGLARTGTTGSHFSGDLFLAFSTANAGALRSQPPTRDGGELDEMSFIPWGRMDPFFAAVAHAVEEAVLNALCAAVETSGRDGRRVPGLPHDRVAALLAHHRMTTTRPVTSAEDFAESATAPGHARAR